MRVKKAGQKLSELFDAVFKRAESESGSAHSGPLGEITDEDIDNLFND